MKVQAVVFDIGNVLLNWDPEGFYDRTMGKVARVRLFRDVPLAEMNLAIDRGAPWPETVEQTAAHHRRWSREIMLWRDRWGEMAAPLIDDSVALLRHLRGKGVLCWALTNFGRETFEHALTLYPALSEFDGAVVSGRIGMLKPEPGIYAMLEREIGVDPAAILFTDDRPENIAAADARGWRTHLFDGAGGLGHRLVSEGLLRETEIKAA